MREHAGTDSTTEGGCLCGAIRYRIDGPIAPGAHCHCSMCRRSTGAVFVTWITVRRDAFHLLTGVPRVYQSSSMAERTFCGSCGAQLTFSHRNAPATIDVTVATFDDPAAHPPDRHIFSLDRIPWLRLDGHLPTYPGDTPPDHSRSAAWSRPADPRG